MGILAPLPHIQNNTSPPNIPLSSPKDEPTTGLDSSAAYSIVKYLSQLSAATNVCCIMTIHQPAQIVFDMLQVCPSPPSLAAI